MQINQNLMSRNHTAYKRSKSDIKWIVIHYVGALGDARANSEYYKHNDVGASADFFVGFSGDVWQANDYYNFYSWHCGGGYAGTYFMQCTNANSVGIEMCVRKRSTATMNAQDKDWYFEDATVKSAVELTKQLMQELDIDADHVIRHYDVNGKWCPAPFCQNNTAHTWAEFKQLISGKSTENNKAASSGNDSAASDAAETGNNPAALLYATQLAGMTEEEKIKAMAPLYQAEQKRSGMLASVGLAQFCLESGYGTTDLARYANNLHGMKCSLSGNTWEGSAWDGRSKYTKQTAEQNAYGHVYYVTADFRKYANLSDSIADRSAYFIGAKVGPAYRYPNINKITDAEAQIRAIKAGGYATDINYVNKLLSLVKRFNLTQYDLDVDGKAGTIKTVSKAAAKPAEEKDVNIVKAIAMAAEAMNTAVKSDIKAGFKWTYTNKKKIEDTFDAACAAGNRQTNCARGVNWLLIEAGVFSAFPGRFFGRKGGTISYQDSATKARVLSLYDVVTVKTKTVAQCIKDGTIQAGDIVTYMDLNHTNLYLGNGKWFDTGHAYCDGGGEGAAFREWIGGQAYNDYKVGCVMRLKETVKPAEPEPAAGTVYRVQVGAYTKKANADARVIEVKEATGFACFVEKIDSYYKVFCGSFTKGENAQERVRLLKAKGIDAFISNK